MASEQFMKVQAHALSRAARPAPDAAAEWRRACGCIRTSDKLKSILQTFPAPPPPSPAYNNSCISARCQNCSDSAFPKTGAVDTPTTKLKDESVVTSKVSGRSMQLVLELAQLVQLSVTATALALYYLIYCYMQLVYYTLRSALYFHNADGPMKITIGVVTVTSLIVGFNLVIRMERMIGIF